MSSAGGSFARSSRARRFISRHRTLCLVLLILGTVVLSSVLAGAHDKRKSKRTEAGAGQKRRTKALVGVLNKKARVNGQRSRNSAASDADREGLEAELFMTPRFPIGATPAATSSATLRATPNNDNLRTVPGVKKEGSLQGNEQTVPARGDNVSRKPKEERKRCNVALHSACRVLMQCSKPIRWRFLMRSLSGRNSSRFTAV